MSKLKNCIKLGGIAAALALSSAANADFIDLFTDPAGGMGVETDGPQQSVTSGNFPLTILGGYRDLIVSNNKLGGDGTCGFGNDCSELSVFGGTLNFNNETTVNGVGEVQWDGGNGALFDPTGLQVEVDEEVFIGENLRLQLGCPITGCDRFVFDVLSADLNFDFVIGIYTDATNWIQYNLQANPGPETSVIPFSFFETNAFCGLTNLLTPLGLVNSVTCGGDGGQFTANVADLNNVGGFFVRFNDASPDGGTLAVDLSIGAITKTGVPEPGILGLLGIGLAAGALSRRKRARA